MDNSVKFSDIINLILGVLSLFGIISGFFIDEFRIIFWTFSLSLLIFVVIGYYVAENRSLLVFLSTKIKKIEESLNIYDRLNKLELAINMKKKGEITLIDIIKIGLAIILIVVFIMAIGSIL